MQDYAERITNLARDQLAELAATGGTVDLMADFTTRFPLTVVCDVLGVPLDRIGQALAACQGMRGSDPYEVGAAMASAAAALGEGRQGLAAELRERVPGELTETQLHYLIFTLIYAGQLTADPSPGFLLAHVFNADAASAKETTFEEFVGDTLRTRRRPSTSGVSPPPTSNSPGSGSLPAPRCSSTSRASTPIPTGPSARTSPSAPVPTTAQAPNWPGSS